MKKLTFGEVIANIKEGEVWESNSKIIKCDHSEIIITNKYKQTNESISFSKAVMYKLQRKEYTFQEAFKAYEEGKIIESLESGRLYEKDDWEGRTIKMTDIRGKWNVNEVE